MTLKIWWSKGPSPGNFGDVLTPYLLDYFGINYRYVQRPRKASALSIGSIAKFAGDRTLILGSGTIRQSDKLNPKADWRFVRGPKTRNIVLRDGGMCPEVYGDPALLLPKFCPESQKKYDIGIVPHYVDHSHARSLYPNEFVIDVLNSNPLKVATQITQCRYIISSSLHGIIAAHAYGIPAAWVEFSNKLCGDRIKFADHLAAVGCDNIKSCMDNPVFLEPVIDNVPEIERQFLEVKKQHA